MQSGHAINAAAPVLAAGVGVRHGLRWPLRSASFRFDPSAAGDTALGILSTRQDVAATLVDLLAGRLAPGYGVLRVLGQDMTTAPGRAAVRRRVGIARRSVRPCPGFRIRGLVEHAARIACAPDHDRHLLVAAIMDRLALTPWSEVPIRSAPDAVVRRARIGAAAVHQPDLLLVEGMLDELSGADLAILTETLGDLARDTAIIAIGRDPEAIGRACPDLLVLADGILIGSRSQAQPAIEQTALPQPVYCD